MSNCGFYFNNDDSVLYKKIEDLLKIRLLNTNSETTGSFRGQYLQDLNFFHSPTEAEILSYLADQESKGKTKTPLSAEFSISRILDAYLPYRNSADPNLNKENKFIRDFATNFGSYFHDCLEYYIRSRSDSTLVAEYNTKKDALINYLLSLKEYVAAHADELSNLQSSNLKNFILNVDLAQLGPNLDNILALTSNLEDFRKGKVFFETVLSTKLSTKENKTIAGRADCIIYNNDGSISIIDFKTSMSYASTLAKQRHYLQLALYRKILALELKIPESKIKIYNLNFIYSSDSFKVGELSNTDTSLGLGMDSVKPNKVVLDFFPITVHHLETKREKELYEETSSAVKLLLDKLQIRYSTKEAVKERILKAYESERSLTLALSEYSITEIKKEDAIYKLYNSKGELIIKGTIDEIVEKNDKEILRNYKLATESIRQAFQTLDLSYIKRTYDKNQEIGNAIWVALSKYMSGEWDYISNPYLEKFNIIQVYNKFTKQTDFISLILDTPYIKTIIDPHKNILNDVYKDQSLIKDFKEFKELPEASIGNLNKLKTYIVIAKYIETLDPNIKIGAIKSFSVLSGLHDLGLDSADMLKAVQLLLYSANNHSDKMLENSEIYYKDIYTKLKNLNWASQEDICKANIVSALKLAEIDDDIQVQITQGAIDLKISALEKLLGELKKAASINMTSNKSFTSKMEILYGEISLYINSLLKLTPNTMYKIHSHSLTFLESLVADFNLLTKADTNKFTMRGLLLTALAQGLDMSTSYANPDLLIRRTDALFNVYNTLIAELLLKELNEINLAIREWFDSLNIPLDNRITGGFTDKYYRRFIKKNSDGSINPEMLFLNPYIKSNEVTFANDKELYALECILWGINRSRMKLGESISSLSYAELKADKDKFTKYKDKLASSINYLKIPLRERQGSSRLTKDIIALLKGKRSGKEVVKRFVDSWHQFVEPVILNEELTSDREKAIKRLEYFNIFNEGEKNRTERTLAEPDIWEINFNQIAGEYIAEHYKTIYFNKFLQTVDKLLATIRLMEISTGQDLSKQFDSLLSRIKINVYNKALIDHEYENLATVFGGVKFGVSLLKIAIRPSLWAKEMMLGRIKNTSAILTNFVTNDEDHPIHFEHLKKAADIVFGNYFFRQMLPKLNDDLKMPFGNLEAGDSNFIDSINDVYLINDRDLNAIGDSLSYDNYGLGNINTRMLYLNTINPDWFNRMTVFVAKMIADGTFDAHSRNENTGLLQYDVSKDERFSEFWKYRNDDGKSAPNKLKYAELKSLYLLRLELFKREGWKDPDTGNNLTIENDPENSTIKVSKLPRCYTQEEVDSIKELIGLLYGYLGHEERVNTLKGLWWLTHTQFLTYLPSSIRKYFANGKDPSSICQVVHVKTLGKNPKKLYWKYDPKTNLTKKVTTTNDDGVDEETGEYLMPVYESVHNPFEGLFTSFLKNFGRIFRGDIKSIKEDPQSWNHTKLFIFNALFAMLVAAILGFLGYSTGKRDTHPLVTMTVDPLQKAANEMDFVQEVITPIDSMGIISVEYMRLIGVSAGKAVMNDNYRAIDFINDNWSLIKDTNIVRNNIV